MERLPHAPSFMLYSIPFAAEKKGIFSKFFDFFQKDRQQPQRKGQHQEKQRDQVRPPVAQPQKKWAEHPEVHSAPQQTKGGTIKADLAAPSLLGPEKQSPGSRQPEQQVQKRPQQRDAHPHPQDAEQIVYHPQTAAQ